MPSSFSVSDRNPGSVCQRRSCYDVPSRTSETKTIGKVSPHRSPKRLSLFLWDESERIVVVFVVLVGLWNIIPVLPLRASATAASFELNLTRLAFDDYSRVF